MSDHYCEQCREYGRNREGYRHRLGAGAWITQDPTWTYSPEGGE